MENIPLDDSVLNQNLIDSHTLACTESFVTSAFVSCDEHLVPWTNSSSVSVVAPISLFRGTPSLKPKGKVLYPAENPAISLYHCNVIPPPFPGRYPTIRFFSLYSSFPEKSDALACESVPFDKRLTIDSKILKFATRRMAKNPVWFSSIKCNGFQLTCGEDWNLYWGARLEESDFATLQPHQRVNHFPGTWILGRKDCLARQIRQAAQRRGSKYFDIAPATYSIPVDLPLLRIDIKVKGSVFIAKPPASACGRGIFLFTGSIPELKNAQYNLEEASANDDEEEKELKDKDDEYIVQQYIANPLLINGFKVDLRVYVACTSFDPLRVYIFNDGLVRFATEPFPLDRSAMDLNNVFKHLTNYSINKNNSAYVATSAPETDGSGSKWSFFALRRYFEQSGLNFEFAWKNVHDVVVKTFIACESTVCSKLSGLRYRSSCFELYGFDVMLDNVLQAHLIEVNVMPSLACSSALDKHIKGHLIADLLTLVGIPLVDKKIVDETVKSNAEQKKFRFGQFDCLIANNLVTTSAAFKPEEFDSDASFINLCDTDKHVLRDADAELSRRGGFVRLIPSKTFARTYSSLFEHPRRLNDLLASWESRKVKFSDVELEAAKKWLEGEGQFPSRLIKKVLSVRPKEPNLPRVISRARSVPTFQPQKPRKPPVLPPIQKKAIPICNFSFCT